jgi:amine acid ABC transporter, permease protein, 3-TM region, His/Glu/Gln/Arg/opine family
MKWDVVSNYSEFFLEGALYTISISLMATVLGTLLAFVLALMRLSHLKLLKAFSFTYVWIFRGVPLILVLFIIYYAAPFGIKLSALQAGVIGISLNSASFFAEIIRAGIVAVPKGQIEAAKAIGMGPMQIMWRVTLPQAVRLTIPPYMNSAVILLKESAQVSVIAVPDLMLRAQNAYNSTYLPVETLGVAGVLYLVMTSLLMMFQSWAERKMRLKT